MNYDEALAYLKHLQFAYKKYALNKITALLEYRGRPQDAYRVVHIVGTNGKGSTAAFISAGLQAAGYRVGTFTSPHLSDFRERFRIDGREVPGYILAGALEAIIPDMQTLHRNPFIGHPTYFETLVALGLELFRTMAVDYAVVEAGLGGRLDGTNVFRASQPVLTNVGLEHTGILGRNLSTIAREKAAVTPPCSTLITGETRPRILDVLRTECARRKAALFAAVKAYRFTVRSMTTHAMRFDARGPGFYLPDITTPLLGRHQAKNALVALAALRHLGITDPETLRRGFAMTRWPGRFEVFPGNPDIILDGAHNPDGIRALVRTLKDTGLSGKQRIVCVFASMRDKKHSPLIKRLAPHLSRVIASRPPTSRAAEPALLADLFQHYGCRDVSVNGEQESALYQALSEAGPDDIVLVTGSLYLVGNLRPRILALR